MEAVGQRGRVNMVSQDSFYKNLTEEEQECADTGEYNFDHPGGQQLGPPPCKEWSGEYV